MTIYSGYINFPWGHNSYIYLCHRFKSKAKIFCAPNSYRPKLFTASLFGKKFFLYPITKRDSCYYARTLLPFFFQFNYNNCLFVMNFISLRKACRKLQRCFKNFFLIILLALIVFIWLDIAHLALFFLLILCLTVKFNLFSSNFLVLLLILEAFILTSLTLLTKRRIVFPLVIYLIFFTLAVTEACLGLRLLISQARKTGLDSVPLS